MDISERYSRNLGTFTEAELARVRESSACIVGCGGLGGYAAASLARFGIGRLSLIDGDVFCPSNLNRQLFSRESNMGESKAVAALEALRDINSETAVTAFPVMLDADNAAALLRGHDVAVDCLDSIPSRRILANACAELDIPLVHGAVSGLHGQAACILPGDRLFDILYPPGSENDVDSSPGNPNFAPQLVAAIQSCEAAKLLAGRGTGLRHRVLYIDMLTNGYEIVELSPDK